MSDDKPEARITTLFQHRRIAKAATFIALKIRRDDFVMVVNDSPDRTRVVGAFDQV